ncbi:MAG: hypothetical protein AAF648_06765 [Pseudomonadota bacterium]
MNHRSSPRLSVFCAAMALSACSAFADSDGDRRSQDTHRRPPPPDLSEAAATLGFAEETLHQAMRNSGGPPPDLDKAAAELGIDVETLRAALPPPPPPRRR